MSLDVKDMHLMKITLHAKCIIEYFTNANYIWEDVVKAKYGLTNPCHIPYSLKLRWSWRIILLSFTKLRGGFAKFASNGSSINVFVDNLA